MPHGIVDAAFKARCLASHTREVRIRSYRWNAGEGTPTVMPLTLPGGRQLFSIPITEGTLTIDSTDPTRRKLTITVPGEEWQPTDEDHPLAPFGQFLMVWVRIDKPDGSWFDWLKLGEFPIVSHELTQPDGSSVVTAADWSQRVNEYGYVDKHSWASRTRVEAIKAAVDEALPRVYTVHSSANANLLVGEEAGQVASGTGRWDWVQAICDAAGLEAFFDRFGDLVIRNAIVDVDETLPGVGPDVGTATNPVASLTQGQGGSITGMRIRTTREGGCNGIILTVTPTASPPKKGSYNKDQYKPDTMLRKWDRGSAAWSDVFGRITVQREKKVTRRTAQAVLDAQRWAGGLLARRRGVIRRLDIDAVPMWWLEPDDRIQVVWKQRLPDGSEHTFDEAHYVEAIEFPLTRDGGPMRVRTRQVTVIELSEPWAPDPDLPLPPMPPPVTPPTSELLRLYQAELKDHPSRLATFREYGKVTSVTDGDTFTVDFYSDSACTIRRKVKHPNGVSYSSLRIRMTGIQAPESDWFGGPEATAALQAILPVGSIVALRSDTNTAADSAGNRRLWREVYKWTGTTWYDLQGHMIDAGKAIPYPLAVEPRNSMNLIVRGKIAAYSGLGLYADPSTYHGQFQLLLFGDPAGADTAQTEYLTLKNVSTASVDVGGWRIGDPSPITSYQFPSGTTIAAGQKLKIIVGAGTHSGTTYYMGCTKTLLNNSYEIGVLYDDSHTGAGRIVCLTQNLNGATNTAIPISPGA